jgi:hypothetical protein
MVIIITIITGAYIIQLLLTMGIKQADKKEQVTLMSGNKLEGRKPPMTGLSQVPSSSSPIHAAVFNCHDKYIWFNFEIPMKRKMSCAHNLCLHL